MSIDVYHGEEEYQVHLSKHHPLLLVLQIVESNRLQS